MKNYLKVMPRKIKRHMTTHNTMSERKRSVFEGMNFSDAELRVPNENRSLVLYRRKQVQTKEEKLNFP